MSSQDKSRPGGGSGGWSGAHADCQARLELLLTPDWRLASHLAGKPVLLLVPLRQPTPCHVLFAPELLFIPKKTSATDASAPVPQSHWRPPSSTSGLCSNWRPGIQGPDMVPLWCPLPPDLDAPPLATPVLATHRSSSILVAGSPRMRYCRAP